MLTIAHKKFKDNLTELINNSGLPAFVLVYILDDCRRALSILADQQLQKDLREEAGTNVTE